MANANYDKIQGFRNVRTGYLLEENDKASKKFCILK